MTSIYASVPGTIADSRCYRLTAKGRACVAFVQAESQTLGSLSRYLHDILLMCGSGLWFEQLRQFVPPRSLEESLRSLLALGLIERLDAEEAPRLPAAAARREPARTAFGQMAFA